MSYRVATYLEDLGYLALPLDNETGRDYFEEDGKFRMLADPILKAHSSFGRVRRDRRWGVPRHPAFRTEGEARRGHHDCPIEAGSDAHERTVEVGSSASPRLVAPHALKRALLKLSRINFHRRTHLL